MYLTLRTRLATKLALKNSFVLIAVRACDGGSAECAGRAGMHKKSANALVHP